MSLVFSKIASPSLHHHLCRFYSTTPITSSANSDDKTGRIADELPSPSPPPLFTSPPTPTPPPAVATCRNCGGPTCGLSPPTPAPWSEVSPPLAYRLIRAPAINTPTITAAIIISPVPQPLFIPIATPSYNFQAPSKRITSVDDIKRFNKSPSSCHFLGSVASFSLMDRRHPKSAPSSPSDDRFHRFLKPGALARIRDSKIIARSVRSVPLSRLSPPSSSAPDEQVVAPETTGRHPRFVFYRVSGPRYLSRKKLVASRSVYFAPPSPDFSDPFVDVGFGSDLVVAH